MNNLYLSVFLCLLFACGETKNENNLKDYPFYLGTYTDGESEGIYKLNIDTAGQIHFINLIAKTTNPSYLAKSFDGKYLLAVNEIDSSGTGTVESYLIESDSLIYLDKSQTGGAHPCHIVVDKKGKILISNYTGGNVGLVELKKTGKLSELRFVQKHIGRSITDRQQGPHAHSAWFIPNSDQIVSVDLGTDQLTFSRLDTMLRTTMVDHFHLKLKPGSGPRHLAFHPVSNNLYVINEISSTVSLIVSDSLTNYKILKTVSTLPIDYEGENSCADIHVSDDGLFLYASNRGHNSITIFEIDQNTGELNNPKFQDVKGDWPRNFNLTPDNRFLIVANQFSNNLVAFKRDSIDGSLIFASQIKVPAPVCIVF